MYCPNHEHGFLIPTVHIVNYMDWYLLSISQVTGGRGLIIIRYLIFIIYFQQWIWSFLLRGECWLCFFILSLCVMFCILYQGRQKKLSVFISFKKNILCSGDVYGIWNVRLAPLNNVFLIWTWLQFLIPSQYL